LRTTREVDQEPERDREASIASSCVVGAGVVGHGRPAAAGGGGSAAI